MTRRLLALLPLLCLMCAGAVPRWPDKRASSVETLIAQFGAADGSFTAGSCARPYVVASIELPCTDTILVAMKNLTITRVTAAVGGTGLGWQGAEACDVELTLNGSTIGSDITLFPMGASRDGCPDTPRCGIFELDSIGSTAELPNLAIAVTAGQWLGVKHEDPAITTDCNDGVSCDCDAADAAYQYAVWGFY